MKAMSPMLGVPDKTSSAVSVGARPPTRSPVMVIVPPRDTIRTLGNKVYPIWPGGEHRVEGVAGGFAAGRNVMQNLTAAGMELYRPSSDSGYPLFGLKAANHPRTVDQHLGT